jgi:hypothetical protein
MKKSILFMSCAIAMSVSLASCSDDDGDSTNVSSGNNNGCVYTTPNGNQIVVSSVDCYGTSIFSYDSNGRITTEGYDDDDGGWVIDYSAGTFYHRINSESKGTFLTNASGYITKMQIDQYGNEYTYTVSYNSDGYLSEIEEIVTGDDYSSTDKVNLTWKNGGKTYSGSFDYSISSTEANKLGQYNCGIVMFFDYNIPRALWMSGLLGKAPAYLPTSYTFSEIDVSKTGTGTATIEYTYNADKSIASEKVKEVFSDDGTEQYSTFKYTYSDFVSRAKAPKRSQR